MNMDRFVEELFLLVHDIEQELGRSSFHIRWKLSRFLEVYKKLQYESKWEWPSYDIYIIEMLFSSLLLFSCRYRLFPFDYRHGLYE